MQRVLQSAGAKRLNQIATSVTHIVMAKEVAGHTALIEKLKISPYKVRHQACSHIIRSSLIPAILLQEKVNCLLFISVKVGLQWVVESMLMGRPVPESDFPFVPLPARPSPAPRKTAALRNKEKASAPAASKSITEAEELTMLENDILAQYKSGSNETAPESAEKPLPAPTEDSTSNANENTTMRDEEESVRVATSSMLAIRNALPHLIGKIHCIA